MAMSDITAVVGPGVTGGNGGGVELQVSSGHHRAVDVSLNLQNMLMTFLHFFRNQIP